MSSSSPSSSSHSRTQDLMSIYNLLNPDGRNSAGSYSTGQSMSGASSASHTLPNDADGPSKEDVLRQKRKVQSEKKRQWRRNLTPEQKERRQILDAQRKREQRMNQTPEQRAEARKKDAARKAAKRRQVKEQMEQEKQQAVAAPASAANHSSRPPNSHSKN